VTTADERADQGRRRGLARRGVWQPNVNLKVLHQYEEKLQKLGLNLPVESIEALFQALGTRLGRQMFLIPVDTSTGMCGLFVETVHGFDLFFYERRTTALHQALMLGHEAAHLILGHPSAQVTREVLAGLLGLDVRLVKRVWARGPTYTRKQERDAEVFGTLIVQRAVRPTVTPQQAVDPNIAEVLARMQAALGASSEAPTRE
jgi:hypothetical protein